MFKYCTTSEIEENKLKIENVSNKKRVWKKQQRQRVVLELTAVKIQAVTMTSNKKVPKNTTNLRKKQSFIKVKKKFWKIQQKIRKKID